MQYFSLCTIIVFGICINDFNIMHVLEDGQRVCVCVNASCVCVRRTCQVNVHYKILIICVTDKCLPYLWFMTRRLILHFCGVLVSLQPPDLNFALYCAIRRPCKYCTMLGKLMIFLLKQFFYRLSTCVCFNLFFLFCYR